MFALIGLLLFLTIGFVFLKKNKEQVIESVAFSKFLNDKSKVDEKELQPYQEVEEKGITEKINDFFAGDNNDHDGDDDGGEGGDL